MISLQLAERSHVRTPSLRQIEALIAFVEAGTVSRAAETLSISQPAASKLLSSLELDTELQLFERDGRRLTLTPQGMRLYEEIDSVFAGVQQIARAVDAIRQEERGRLLIGVMPALSGPLIRRAVAGFSERNPEVYVSVIERSSQFLSDWLNRRQIDVAIISIHSNAGSVRSEPLGLHPLVCVVPKGHHLATKGSATPQDLHHERFVAFSSNNLIRSQIDRLFEAHGVKPHVVLDATTARNVCEFVAAGLGVTIVHPLTIADSLRAEVAIVPLHPPTDFSFQLCHPRECRNIALVEDFREEMKMAVSDNLNALERSSL